MPNGKGFIDCRYCVYAWPSDGHWPVDEKIICLYHQQNLPETRSPGAHRFCINIQPNETWFSEYRGLHIFFPFLQQVARFGAELEPGVLYEYEDQCPESLATLKKLREPDYECRSWKPIASNDQSTDSEVDGDA